MTFTGLRDDYMTKIDDFMRLVEEYDVKDSIKITRYREMQKAYDECDIVISPERYCSYGLSISESLSLNIPTVLSNIPTYLEIAQTFEHAYFFENGSAEDLARAITHAIQDTQRSQWEGVRFRKRFDLRDCAKRYSEIYFSVNQKSNAV